VSPQESVEKHHKRGSDAQLSRHFDLAAEQLDVLPAQSQSQSLRAGCEEGVKDLAEHS
jgi:hypothetical protein